MRCAIRCHTPDPQLRLIIIRFCVIVSTDALIFWMAVSLLSCAGQIPAAVSPFPGMFTRFTVAVIAANCPTRSSTVHQVSRDMFALSIKRFNSLARLGVHAFIAIEFKICFQRAVLDTYNYYGERMQPCACGR